MTAAATTAATATTATATMAPAAGKWEAEWSAWRRRRQDRDASSHARRAPSPGSPVRMPDGLDERAAAAYRARMRSIAALVASREIAERYPFVGAVAHLKEQKCPFGSLFAGPRGQNDRVFDAAERYVAHSIAHEERRGGRHGGGGGGGAGTAARQRPRPHAGAGDVEIDGRAYCEAAVVHALALMIAHMCGPRTAAKFAMGQAEWTRTNMRLDMGESAVRAPARFVQDYIWCLMPYEEAEAGAMLGAAGRFRIGVPAYLSRSVQIADPAWKMVNRRVEGGYVVVGRDELLRLARHDIFQAIEMDAAGARVDRRAAAALETQARGIATSVRFDDEAVRAASTAVGSGGRPPCVTDAIASLGRAENLPHHGRLLVASYLLRAGESEEDVAALFASAPDYSEATTRRQVAHIARVGYMPKSCEGLESLGLCRRTPACGTIKNPVQFQATQKKTATEAPSG